MFDIEEYSKKMKNAELFQGMGFNRILEFKEDTVRFEFLVESRHCHSGNIAQGGYVTGWIDTTMAHLAMVSSEFSINPLTLELKVSFFKPANPGIVTTSAKIIKMGNRNIERSSRVRFTSAESYGCKNKTCFRYK